MVEDNCGREMNFDGRRTWKEETLDARQALMGNNIELKMTMDGGQH